MRTNFFQSCGHCWVFQICWHIECSTLTASSFRILKSSAGIPLLPPPLFIAMLPKAHLTSHSRMSSSRWVTTPLWLSGSLKPFLYSSSMYSYHLFLNSSASLRSLPLLSFIVSILAWNVPLISPIIWRDLWSFTFCCFPLSLCMWLIMLFAAKDGEGLHSRQKQQKRTGLTVAQIMSSLLKNPGLNWRK